MKLSDTKIIFLSLGIVFSVTFTITLGLLYAQMFLGW